MAVAAEAWSEVGDSLEALVANPGPSPEEAPRSPLVSMVGIGRSRPHLYRLMFTTPVADPTAAVRAAERAQDLFVDVVTRVVGPDSARPIGALLLIRAHGITGLEDSGHLVWDKWPSIAEDVIDLLMGPLPDAIS